MPFSTLPPEMVYQIILHAVKERGIKRAGRLRYVSKSWDATVLDAICVSGVLDAIYVSRVWDRRVIPNCPYISRYFAQRIMGRPQTLCTLRIIRQVAARIISHRNKGRDDGDSYDALRDCVFDLCRLWIEFKSPCLDYWFRCEKSLTQPFDENDERFLQALLAAAAWTNEVALVHELLPFFRDSPHMISLRPGDPTTFSPVFGYPIPMAARRGHNEIMSLLIDAVITNGFRDHFVLGEALWSAVRGNQLSTVELILKPQLILESGFYNSCLHHGLRHTADINIFKRLAPIARGQDFWILSRWVCDAASNGNLAILKHLIEEEGAKPTEWEWPLEEAARNGRMDALVYLLRKGFPLRPGLPLSAAKSRNPDVMRVIIEAGTQQNTYLEPGPALVTATERENDRVVRLLLRCEHVKINDEYKARALQRAEELGLESMAEMLDC
ncbi:hypothetical protein F4680DRAFT_465380 [Xylaria scruposa]|nr:hypothetical protein F4680DRAFT_465380 [Xylaria scruposa]